jgi:hypothetical protein
MLHPQNHETTDGEHLPELQSTFPWAHFLLGGQRGRGKAQQ